MSSANDVNNLNGMFKQTYASKMENLIPEGTKLLQEIPFLPKDQQPGRNFSQPVVLN